MSAKKAAKPSANQTRLAGAALRAALGDEDLATLGFALDDSAEAPSPQFVFARVLDFLRSEAEAKREAARKNAAKRVPLIAPRYAPTLATAIHSTLTHRSAKDAFTWASIATAALHGAYMSGAPVVLSTHDAHPGSRSGVIIVDCRTPDDFADEKGNITGASVLARVKGEPKPKGGA